MNASFLNRPRFLRDLFWRCIPSPVQFIEYVQCLCVDIFRVDQHSSASALPKCVRCISLLRTLWSTFGECRTEWLIFVNQYWDVTTECSDQLPSVWLFICVIFKLVLIDSWVFVFLLFVSSFAPHGPVIMTISLKVNTNRWLTCNRKLLKWSHTHTVVSDAVFL